MNLEVNREEAVTLLQSVESSIAFADRMRCPAVNESTLAKRLRALLVGEFDGETEVYPGLVETGPEGLLVRKERVLNYGVQSAEAERLAREGAPNTLHYECRCDEGAPHEYPCPLSADALVER